jgi:hypothetical protein
VLYFIDESGHDHGSSPYEVLAAVAVQERDLWNLIQAIRDAEMEFFGVRFSQVGIEFKGSSLFSVGAGMQREARTGLPEISRGRKPPDFHRLRRRPGGAAEITGADNRDAILGAENQRE